MNKVILIGNLAKDVEVKHSQSGLAIGRTSIATNRKVKNQQTGQYDKDEVMFIDLTIFGNVTQHLRKGSKISVEGRLQFQQWQDQNGNKKSKHIVVVENLEFVGCKTNDNGNSNNHQNQPQQNQPTPHYQSADNADSVPF